MERRLVIGAAPDKTQNTDGAVDSPTDPGPQAPATANASDPRFNLAAHLLHERLSPPPGYGWLLHRIHGQLWVTALPLDHVPAFFVAGRA